MSYYSTKLKISLLPLLIFALSAPLSIFASSTTPKIELFVLYSQLTPDERAFLLDAISELKRHSDEFELRIIDTDGQDPATLQRILRGSHKCILTVSDESLNKVLGTRTNIPIFSTLVSRFNLDILSQKYHQLGVNLSGIYHEQPIFRQVLLAKAINQNLKSFSVILGRKTRYYLKTYQQLANTFNLELSFIILKRNSTPNSFLANKKLEHEILLTINDDHHYSEENLKSLFMLANKNNISIIGNKARDTKLAAIASIQTDLAKLPLQIASELKSICRRYKNEGDSPVKLTPAIYSQDFEVSVNQQIAASIGQSNLDKADLRDKIMQMQQQMQETIQ